MAQRSIDAVRHKGVAYVGEGVEIRPSGIPGAGNGLFATVAFGKNDYITEYDGYFVDRDAVASLPADEVTHFRSLGVFGVIAGFKDPKDAYQHGGASFANDSREAKNNNSKFIQVWDKKNCVPRVFLMATQEIAVGQEIYVSYANDYWKRYD